MEMSVMLKFSICFQIDLEKYEQIAACKNYIRVV